MKQRLIYIIGVLLLLLSPVRSEAQISYQYWIDNDTGSAVSGTTTDGASLSLNIDVAALSPGVHFYNIRARQGVKWGTVYRYIFSIPREANAASSQLKNYEYWLDNDYEHRVLKAGTGSELTVTSALDVSSLSPGVHFFNLRAQDAKGAWGSTQRSLFCIPREQNENTSRLITGYRYGFGDDLTTVTLTSPVSEYTLVKNLDAPDPPLPMTIDDDCHFSFSDEGATLLRNVEMSFVLTFTDEAEAMSSPVGTSFTVTDTRTSDILSLSVPGTLSIPAHATGGYTVVKFEIPSAGSYVMKSTSACSLRLYSSEGALLDAADAEVMTAGYSRDYEEGTYYAVAFGNAAATTLSINVADENLLKPTLTYADNVVTISSSLPGATFYFTLDGSDPTTASTLYEAPIPVDRNLTVKAIASWTGFGVSPVATLELDLFTVNDVTFTQDGSSLTLSTTTEGATISYRLNEEEWTVYNNALTLEGTYQVEAYATKDGYNDSQTTSYLFSYTRPTVYVPQITHEEDLISITCNTEGATIYYTTDGCDPTTASTVYTESFTVTENCTIKAFAVKDGCIDSEVTSLVVDWIVIGTPCGYAVLDTETGTLTFKYGIMPEGENVWNVDDTNYSYINQASWDCSKLKKVVFDASFAEARPKSTAYWFCKANELTAITGIEYLNTSNVTDMCNMFDGCSGLTSLDVTHFDTSNVRNMNGLFRGCSSLVSLDVSQFNTSNVVAMGDRWTSGPNSIQGGMFEGCSSLQSLDLRNFDTSNVKEMSGMFKNCSSLTSLDLSHFNTRQLLDMAYMFGNCSSLTSLDVSNFDTSHIEEYLKDTEYINGGGLTGTFYGCSSLTVLDLSSFDTHTVHDMGRLFANCSKLKTIYVSEKWSTEHTLINGTNSGLFTGCINLTGQNGTKYDASHTNTTYARIDGGADAPGYLSVKGYVPTAVVVTPVITHNDDVITISTTTEEATIYYTLNGDIPTAESLYYNGPFTVTENCTVKAIAIREGYKDSEMSSLTVNWIDGSKYCGYAIYDSNSKTLTFRYGAKPADNRTEEGIWVYDADNTDIRDGFIATMYTTNPWYSTDITTVIFDSSFAKARPSSTAYWFNDCNSLTTIIGIEYLNTEEVVDMSYMFKNCKSLTSLDLSHFNTAKVGCRDIWTIPLRGAMHFMFSYCINLTYLDLSSFTLNPNLDFSLDLQHMFSMCSGLRVVDISGLDNVDSNMSGLFNGCPNLTQVYVGKEWSNEKITSSEKMFQGCTNLVGGAGTKFDSNYMDATYARIDGGTGNPGYFTSKAGLKKGDANGDGTVDNKDVDAIVSYIMEGDTTNFNYYAADANEDGKINVADITVVVNIIRNSAATRSGGASQITAPVVRMVTASE